MQHCGRSQRGLTAVFSGTVIGTDKLIRGSKQLLSFGAPDPIERFDGDAGQSNHWVFRVELAILARRSCDCTKSFFEYPPEQRHGVLVAEVTQGAKGREAQRFVGSAVSRHEIKQGESAAVARNMTQCFNRFAGGLKIDRADLSNQVSLDRVPISTAKPSAPSSVPLLLRLCSVIGIKFVMPAGEPFDRCVSCFGNFRTRIAQRQNQPRHSSAVTARTERLGNRHAYFRLSLIERQDETGGNILSTQVRKLGRCSQLFLGVSRGNHSAQVRGFTWTWT